MGPFAVSIKSLTLPLIDRYLFRQLLIPTILATMALAAIGILSQSLSALDVLVDERQGLTVFIKVALLAMPQLMVIVLPVAILVAGLAALNRLHTEQEIVICFAGGMSRWRVIAPAVRLSLLAALASLVLSLWIQPYCFRILRQTLQDVRADLAATLIKPGRFTHPAPGVTVYAQSVGEDGLIRNLFIDIVDARGRDTTLTAGRRSISDPRGKPMLILQDVAAVRRSRRPACSISSPSTSIRSTCARSSPTITPFSTNSPTATRTNCSFPTMAAPGSAPTPANWPPRATRDWPPPSTIQPS